MPMDFDGVVERYGHVLIFETKNEGKEIDPGQRITLTDQWKKGATIFVVSGKTPEKITGIAQYWEKKYQQGVSVGDLPLKECESNDVVYFTRRWFCKASGLSIPTREQWDAEIKADALPPDLAAWVADYEKVEAKYWGKKS